MSMHAVRRILFLSCAAGVFFALHVPNSSGDTWDPGALPLYSMPGEGIETRWYTYENRNAEKGEAGTARFGRKGAPNVSIPKGKEQVLLETTGSGTVRRFWCTLFDHGSTEALRGLVVEMYWDGSTTPAVRAPLGDFFCHSLGHNIPFANACFSSPEGRSFNCTVPMPFRTGAKILVRNESNRDNGIYYDIAVTKGDVHGSDMLYFHTYWRRENPTTLRKDMTILPTVKGRGRFLGCNLGVRLTSGTANFWWGEGEVKIYLDGDGELPTLCGTGTEDYIGTGYGQGLFSHPYQGDQYISKAKDAYGFYRFHIPDPVYFRKDCRVTIQVMGGPSYPAMLESMEKVPGLRFMKAGKGDEYYTREELEKEPKRSDVMERVDDHTATAYWYMDQPEDGLPPLPPFEERAKDLPE